MGWNCWIGNETLNTPKHNGAQLQLQLHPPPPPPPYFPYQFVSRILPTLIPIYNHHIVDKESDKRSLLSDEIYNI